MIDISLLKLLNTLLVLNKDERETIFTSDEFKDIRESITPYVTLSEAKDIKKQINTAVMIACDYWLDYIDCLTHTNQALSNYIDNFLTDNKPYSPMVIASAVCSLGNASTEYDVPAGLAHLKESICKLKTGYMECVDGETHDLDQLNDIVDRLDRIGVLCQALCTFMVAKYGSAKGVGEHFGQNVEERPTDLGEATTIDAEVFAIGEIQGTESFNTFDHYSTMVSGLEQFINAEQYTPYAQQSYDQRYLSGILMCNGLNLDRLAGQEGAVWDKVKTGMQKAYQMIRDGLVAMKENYFDKSLQEIADATKTAADANKKALNAVSEKDAAIPDNVKASVTRLAQDTGNDAAVTAVSGLSTVSDASNVIDKLMIVFTASFNASTELQKEFDQIDSDLKALESSTTSGSPDDEDKDAIQVKKAAISEKSKELKDRFNELKTKLANQRKEINAISKAIKGITPGIFVAPKKEETK